MIAVLKKREIKFALIAITFLPPMFQTIFNFSSMAFGLLLASSFVGFSSFILWGFRANTNLSKPTLNLILLIFFLIITHFLISGVFVHADQAIIRFLIGSAGFIFFISAASLLSYSLLNLKQEALQKIIIPIVLILSVNVIFSIFRIDFFETGLIKPTFLFTEPSLLAITSSPFLIFYFKRGLPAWRLVAFLFFIWALLIQNTTMMVVFILASLILFRIGKFLTLLLLMLGCIYFFSDFEYYLSRIIFSTDNINLSSLVFIDGWERAILNLRETNGWGVGFNQFGIAASSGEVRKELIELGFANLNLLDGGSLAAKLVGEFGFFGLFILLFCVLRATRSFFRLKSRIVMPDLITFALCVDVAFLVELFIRGVGYFTPGVFIYIMMVFYRWQMQLSKNYKYYPI